jgi:hypothetical protein
MVEVEGRKDSLEKELATKDSYIRELEDIIVEKVRSFTPLYTLNNARDPFLRLRSEDNRQFALSCRQCCGSEKTLIPTAL